MQPPICCLADPLAQQHCSQPRCSLQRGPHLQRHHVPAEHVAGPGGGERPASPFLLHGMQLRAGAHTVPCTRYPHAAGRPCLLFAPLGTQAFDAGVLRAIGVSNYNATQLEEIAVAGMPLPAVNQIPLHIYRSTSQQDTVQWCEANGVVVNAYSPFGVPDYHSFPGNGYEHQAYYVLPCFLLLGALRTSPTVCPRDGVLCRSGMSPLALEDPVVVSIAKAHGRTPAAVTAAWLWQQV
jgi:hypothetical protein